MTFDKQITIGFLIMLSIIIIVSAVCMYNINSLKNTRTTVGDNELTLSELIQEFTGSDEESDEEKTVLEKNVLFDAIKIADKQIGVAYFNIFIVASLAIFFGGLITLLFPRRVTKPILKLVDATVNIREGDYSYRVEDIQGTNEIATLVTSFNRMLSSIEYKHMELEDKNEELELKNDINKKLLRETEQFNETLENKVAEVKAELKANQSKLIKNEKLATVGELATKIAHEIRNPLSGIALALENLNKILSNDSQRDMVSDITREVDRLNGIIVELFQLAIPRELKLQKANPNTLVSAAADIVRKEAGENNIRIELNMTNEYADVSMDYEQMQQVLINILINAIHAINKPGGVIAVSTSYDDDNLMIRISDNGPGMDREIMEKIFEPFYSTKKNGSGLGLSICENIVEAHGGEILVESEGGSGANFTLLIPKDASEFNGV